MVDNRIYALVSALFFAVLAWGLITYGGNLTKFLAFMSLLAGGMSQFFAQSDRGYVPATVAAVMGLAAAILGVVTFTWGL